jgi:hypothetical protein
MRFFFFLFCGQHWLDACFRPAALGNAAVQLGRGGELRREREQREKEVLERARRAVGGTGARGVLIEKVKKGAESIQVINNRN